MSGRYLGDFAEDSTVTFPWDSNDGDGASATRTTDGDIYVQKVGALASSSATAATITKANPGVVTDTAHGLENGDEVFFYNLSEMTEVNQTIQTVANKADNTFEIENTSGHGAAESTGGAWIQVNEADVTDTEDYKGVTGSHLVAIDTNVDDYFTTATDYFVYLNAATIDTQVVNATLAQFSIENRSLESLHTELEKIANVGAAVHVAAESYTLTTGTQISGTYASTLALDTTYHQHTDDTGTLELYYQFDVGGDGVPTSVTFTGRINGTNDDTDMWAYNWGSPGWDQVGVFEGKSQSSDDVNTYELFTSHVGTGTDLGKVRVRLYQTGLSNANLYVDQVYLSYSVVHRSVGYAGGAIWVDTNASNTNTESFVDGTADNPVSTWAAALTVSGNLNLNRFQIGNGSAITLSGNSDNYCIEGQGYTLALGSQSIDALFCFGGSISGTGTATNHPVFEDCPIGNVTLPPSIMRRCFLSGTITNSGTGDWFINHCMSRVAGSGAPVFDFGTAVGSTNLHMRLYSGGIQLESMGDTGTDVASIEGQGQIIEGTCTGGAVTVRGLFTTSGITNITLSDDGRLDTGQVRDSVVDDATRIDASALNTLSGYAPSATIATPASVKTAIEAGGSSLAQILTDTGDLQTNQGAWLTVTGFATPTNITAGTITTVTTLTNLPSISTDWLTAAGIKADAVTKIQAGLSTHNAAAVKTAIEAAGSSIAQILEDTNELELDWKDDGRLDAILDTAAGTGGGFPTNFGSLVISAAGIVDSNPMQIHDDATAAANLEKMLDGSGITLIGVVIEEVLNIPEADAT